MKTIDYIKIKDQPPPENREIFIFIKCRGIGLGLWYGFHRDGEWYGVVPDDEGITKLSDSDIVGWYPVTIFNGVTSEDCSHMGMAKNKCTK